MITNDLLVITMGIAFYLIPLLLGVSILVFLWRIRAVSGARGRPRADRLRAALKDPITVVVVLLVGGFVMVAFLSGRFSLADYFSVPLDSFKVLSRTVTEWDDPLSSESIALRGGVLIGIVSAVVVAVTSRSYFRARLDQLDEGDGPLGINSH